MLTSVDSPTHRYDIKGVPSGGPRGPDRVRSSVKKGSQDGVLLESGESLCGQ